MKKKSLFLSLLMLFIAFSMLNSVAYAKKGNGGGGGGGGGGNGGGGNPPPPPPPPSTVGGPVAFAAPQASIGQNGNLSMHDVNNDGLADMTFYHFGEIRTTNHSEIAIHHNAAGAFLDTADQVVNLDDANSWNAMVVEFGDVNGDGFEDIVYMGSAHKLTAAGGPADAPFSTDPTLFVAINQGDGTFATGQGISVIAPSALTNASRLQIDDISIADLNADGINDIVLSFYVAGSGFNSAEQLNVLINTTPVAGSAITLATAVTLDTTKSVFSTSKIADMNNDGTLDIVTTHAADRFISIWFNAGDGVNGNMTTISLRDSHNTFIIPHLVDVNADGAIDIVAVYGNFYKVLKNKGGRKIGQFKVKPVHQVPGTTGLGVSPMFSVFSHAMQDVNNDNYPDLVVKVERNSIGSTAVGFVAVMYGDGSNAFGQTATTQITDFGPTTLNSGAGALLTDIENDGDADIIYYGSVYPSRFRSTFVLENTLIP